MKKVLLFLFCVSAALLSRAQQLSSSVVATSGDQFAKSSGSLDWTLGEIMTETYQKTAGYFTQGFQQPAVIKVTGIDELKEENLFVYPNPAREVLYVKTSEKGDYQFELFNLQGQRLVNRNASVSGTQIQEIDLRGFSSAIYLLRIFNTSTGTHSHHKIEIF